jgi:hypothetical protein
MPKFDLNSWRGQWQSAKDVAETDNKTNTPVRDLLKSFDKGLGPALDKIMAAGRAKNPAEVAKRADAALKVLKDYQAKVSRIPKDQWSTARSWMSVKGVLEFIDGAVTEQRDRAIEAVRRAK